MRYAPHYPLIRYTAMLVLLTIALPAKASSNWERLWFNADQRGEKLLRHGDAGEAARIYKDPRRRAYAEMKAGNYRQAASELDKLHDSDSDYNRGNALAKMGDLKGALDAYDAALKSDPKNHDAQHNRDLVEKALKQQQPQQNSQQQNGQQKNGQSKDDQQDSKSGGKQGSNSDGQDSQSGKNNGKPSDGNSPERQNQNAQQNPQSNPGKQGSNANAAVQSRQGQDQDRNGMTAARQQANPGSQSASGQSPNNQSADEATQARKDAEAGLAASGATGNRITNAAPPTSQTAPQTAPSEQQLSQQQWLRNIPDDPGGLLRRKFMIEYMLRQQKAQQ